MTMNMKNVLEIGAQLSTILAFTYGLFWLERYRKQKIVEHQSDDAKKGLEQLVLIEESLDKVMSGNEGERKEALAKTLPKALRELYNALLLLKALPGIPEKLHRVGHLSEGLADAKTQPDLAVEVIHQAFAPVGGYKHEFKELKDYLIRIYVLRA